MQKTSRIIIVTASLTVVALILAVAFSVADGYFEHKEHHEKGKDKHGTDTIKYYSTSGANSTGWDVYNASCGGCHWAFIPALLPHKSWENILGTLSDHFGNPVQLTTRDRESVAGYLLSNASDKTSLKIGRKITQSLGGSVPGRIVEVPYIVRKHKKIDPATFSRESIRSLSNCIACHPSAANAMFDDDDVKIPSK